MDESRLAEIEARVSACAKGIQVAPGDHVATHATATHFVTDLVLLGGSDAPALLAEVRRLGQALGTIHEHGAVEDADTIWLLDFVGAILEGAPIAEARRRARLQTDAAAFNERAS